MSLFGGYPRYIPMHELIFALIVLKIGINGKLDSTLMLNVIELSLKCFLKPVIKLLVDCTLRVMESN